jgi:hypothetical protein
VADAETLLALKLNAVAGRGERKDFVDVYALCQESGWTVADLLGVARERVPATNDAHLLRRLTYFDDAEAPPLPQMCWPIGWAEVRRFFQDGVRQVLRR